jgi:hypothetical protein
MAIMMALDVDKQVPDPDESSEHYELPAPPGEAPRASRRRRKRILNRRQLKAVATTSPKVAGKPTRPKWYKKSTSSKGQPDPRARLQDRHAIHDVIETIAPVADGRISEAVSAEEVVPEVFELFAEGADSPVIEAARLSIAPVSLTDLDVFGNDVSPEILELLNGRDPESVLELPLGFHVEDEGGGECLIRCLELKRLQRAAIIEPDWGDPDLWDLDRHEPRVLLVRR